MTSGTWLSSFVPCHHRCVTVKMKLYMYVKVGANDSHKHFNTNLNAFKEKNHVFKNA